MAKPTLLSTYISEGENLIKTLPSAVICVKLQLNSCSWSSLRIRRISWLEFSSRVFGSMSLMLEYLEGLASILSFWMSFGSNWVLLTPKMLYTESLSSGSSTRSVRNTLTPTPLTLMKGVHSETSSAKLIFFSPILNDLLIHAFNFLLEISNLKTILVAFWMVN